MSSHRDDGGPSMDRRRFLAASGLGLAGALTVSGCGRTSTASGGGAAGFPRRPITMIVCYAAGGGTDVGARLLQPHLERELGGTVNVVNKTGGGGWVGWSDLLSAKPDGYTIAFINSPNFIPGMLNPEIGIKHKADDFLLLGNQVTDYGVIAVRPDDKRFGTLRELMEHAKQNRLTAGSTGVGSDDHFAALGINDAHGTKFEAIQSDGTAENVTALLGGNLDVLFANVGEVAKMHDSRQVKALGVLARQDKKPPFMTDVPTLAEAGYPGVDSSSSRGLVAPRGLPDDLAKHLVDGVRRAIQNAEHITRLSQQGLLVDYVGPDEYRVRLDDDVRRVGVLGDKYIW